MRYDSSMKKYAGLLKITLPVLLFALLTIPPMIRTYRQPVAGRRLFSQDKWSNILRYFGTEGIEGLEYTQIAIHYPDENTDEKEYRLTLRVPQEKVDEMNAAVDSRQAELDEGWVLPEGIPASGKVDGRWTVYYLEPFYPSSNIPNTYGFSFSIHIDWQQEEDEPLAVLVYKGVMARPDTRSIVHRAQMPIVAVQVVLAFALTGCCLLYSRRRNKVDSEQ